MRRRFLIFRIRCSLSPWVGECLFADINHFMTFTSIIHRNYLDNFFQLNFFRIHTHPSQTSFLSSVDLHTQCGYQIMLPEAIAIVLAPKYNEMGFYSLTSSGLEFISKCNLTGFHPHPSDQFMEAVHFELDKEKKITVVDLRVR